MPKLLFVTVPTDEVLNKEGKVRFPGSEAAVESSPRPAGRSSSCDPTWPKPLEAAKAGSYDAVLVSTYKAVPRSRDAASMLSRMHDVRSTPWACCRRTTPSAPWRPTWAS